MEINKNKKCFVLFAFVSVALIAVSVSFYCNHRKWKILKQTFVRIPDKKTCHFSDGQKALDIMKLLSPKEVVDKNLIRIGRAYDGGYVMVDDFDNCVAYSFGISDDVSWDFDIAKRGIDVYMYDHTIDSLPVYDERFHFFKTGICGESDRQENLKTFEEILSDNGHVDNRNIILKIDVEGAEWNAFNETSSELLKNFRQIVVEFHSINDVVNGSNFNKTMSVLNKLNLTHQVVHIHANNFGSYDIIGGVPIPNTYEVTYLIRDGNEFRDNVKSYPIDGLDKPNCPEKGDYYLGLCGTISKN